MNKNKLTKIFATGLLSMSMATTVFGAVTPLQGIVVNQTTLVPIRALSEAMGVEINYEQATQKITVVSKGITTIMYPNNATATINQKEVKMTVAPKAIDGTTYVPLRFVGEAIGATVNYDNATAVISVNLNGVTKEFKLSSDGATTKPETTSNKSVDMFNKAVKGVTLPPSLADIPDNLFADMYGLDASTYSSYKIMVPKMSGNITEIAIVEAKAGQVAAVEEKLKARLSALQNGGAFYPAHVEIVNKGKVVTNGNFVMMVADENVTSIVNNFMK